PERIVGVLVDVTNSQTIRCDVKEVYPLQIGWALKENQKFGKKGAGKRMTNQVRALLEGYFMAGNADKSNRYTAQDMQRELEKCAQEGEIDKDDVPKVTTIQNWISKTTREHREEAATRVLNYNN
ncbi:3372_t:CDS:2, partial [Rhizophagus irregularis]